MSPSMLVIVVLACVGVFFTLVSAIGILRLPDVYARMHAASKAPTLGIGGVLLAAGLYYGEDQLLRMIILIALYLITSPIATTTMARAAYRTDPNNRSILHYDELAAAQAQEAEAGEPPQVPERLSD